MNNMQSLEQDTTYRIDQTVTAICMKSKTDILIVDDSALIVEKIKELLEDTAGIAAIKSCGTYAEAIALLLHFTPAVVLLDINLPDESGIALLTYIKASFPKTVVIMVTNQSEEYYKNLCLQLGADGFIDKSKDFEKISEMVAVLQ